jgi:phosphatidylserine/phosphatidylglycerophosphate/cardiolipin synthase-like enzyme
MNEILRRAILGAGLDEVDVAARLEVDPKTVRRWLEGRVPYARHRWALADLLHFTEIDLWPELQPTPSQPEELVAIFPHRSLIPSKTWHSLFALAEHEIDILTGSGQFLVDDPEILDTLLDKARASVRIRIAISAPHGPHVTESGAVVDVSDDAASNIHRSLDLLHQLRMVDNSVELRLHRTILYNSIYRADGELLVNQHVFGIPFTQEAVLHLRRRHSGDMVSTYVDSFERVWVNAVPYLG